MNIWINGTYYDKDNAKVSVFDHMPGIKGADDMIRKPQQGLESDDATAMQQELQDAVRINGCP